MNEKETIKILQKWGDEQIADMLQILETNNVNATGNLSKSLKFQAKIVAEGLLLQFFEAPYGVFVRKGVRGSISSAKAPSSPFAYTNKMPPAGALDRWAIKKGISGTRDAKGRFITRKSLIFAIRFNIFRFGIAPLNYTSSFFKNINDLQGKISEEQKREILLLLTKAFK